MLQFKIIMISKLSDRLFNSSIVSSIIFFIVKWRSSG